jgi:hypothetical protein
MPSVVVGPNFEFDRSRWPIAVYRLTGVMDEACVDAYCDAVKEDLATGEVSFSINDMWSESRMPPGLRRRLVELTSEMAEQTAALRYSMAFVVTSPFLRGALTSIFWLKKPAARHLELFEDFDSALAWTEERHAEFRAD